MRKHRATYLFGTIYLKGEKKKSVEIVQIFDRKQKLNKD
ncbi:unnamed protein product [Brugia timori]|uniref:Transposase n=1 Tax=Brugia timori TaxID=42155 RepID=A0A0R3QEY2_9BILA|nr:unnamed protein product [Brugia timori]